MNRIRVAFGIAALVFVAAACQADELKALGNKSVVGTLERITEKEIIFKTDAGPVATPMTQVLLLSLRDGRNMPAEAKYTEIELVDGSLLRCVKVTFQIKAAQVELTTGVSVTIPLSAFVSVLREAHDPGYQKQWAKLMKTRTLRDRIFISSMGNLNPIEGVLGEIDEAKQTIKFKHDAGELEAGLDKLQGLQFVRVQVQSDAPIGKIYDIDGNQLVASRITGAGAQFQVTTPFGAKVLIDPKVIAKIDFNFGKLTFLSDLEARATDSAFLGGFKTYRTDLNLDGLPIVILDKKYEKGLSMYAGTELEYDLGGRYKDFKAILGADARIAEEGQGKVIVSIYCDRVRVFQSKEITAKDAIPISINVKEIDKLRIVVSGPDPTNYAGHATLANAHVSQ